jgi:hypothetical protein
MFFCNNCGSKISIYTIKKQFRRACTSQCSRWINYYKCDNCNKFNDYKIFKNHKSKMKKILLLINNNIKK